MEAHEQQGVLRTSRALFWAEALLASLAGLLATLTLFSRAWIEIVFGVDPDGGDGSLEWFVVAALALVAVIFAAMARVEWRRLETSRV